MVQVDMVEKLLEQRLLLEGRFIIFLLVILVQMLPSLMVFNLLEVIMVAVMEVTIMVVPEVEPLMSDLVEQHYQIEL